MSGVGGCKESCMKGVRGLDHLTHIGHVRSHQFFLEWVHRCSWHHRIWGLYGNSTGWALRQRSVMMGKVVSRVVCLHIIIVIVTI